MNIRQTLFLTGLLFSPVRGEESGTDQPNPFDRTYSVAMTVVHPEGHPVVGAKIGTGLNVFENSDQNPPTTKTMWVLGHRRTWPLRTDLNGNAEFVGNRRPKGFYAVHALVGFGILCTIFFSRSFAGFQPLKVLQGNLQPGAVSAFLFGGAEQINPQLGISLFGYSDIGLYP